VIKRLGIAFVLPVVEGKGKVSTMYKNGRERQLHQPGMPELPRRQRPLISFFSQNALIPPHYCNYLPIDNSTLVYVQHCWLQCVGSIAQVLCLLKALL